MSLKEDIILESMKLFSLKGFVNTGVNDIIEAVDSSKGGFYNHFCSKEDLFYEVLAHAQKIWRERVLYGLKETQSPLEKVIKIIENYRDRYLKDGENFPGGCIFITFSVELDDQYPELVKEVNNGFVGLKNMIRGFLEEAKVSGALKQDVDTQTATELIFSGMVGSSVLYGVDKSPVVLDRSLNALIDYLNQVRKWETVVTEQ